MTNASFVSLALFSGTADVVNLSVHDNCFTVKVWDQRGMLL